MNFGTKIKFSIIYAVGPKGEFSTDDNKLPFTKNDLSYFKKITTSDVKGNFIDGNIVIMGYQTYLSLPFLLPHRQHIVIARPETELPDSTIFAVNLDDALIKADLIKSPESENKRVFLIGGQKLIENAFTHPSLEHIYETIIPEKYIMSNVKINCLLTSKQIKNKVIYHHVK